MKTNIWFEAHQSMFKHLLIYCEGSPNETSVYFQSVYYNETVSSNQRSIYANSQLVKWSGEKGRKVEEGDR